jgi:hypothetical protein
MYLQMMPRMVSKDFVTAIPSPSHRFAAGPSLSRLRERVGVRVRVQRPSHFFLPGRMPMYLQMMPSMISSAPPPIEPRRVSR